MKITKYLLAFAIIIATANITNAQQNNTEEATHDPNGKADSSKRSIPAIAKGKIGEANVSISYHSPGVRQRIIWGGLVPYDEVWVTGAHSATSLEVDKPFRVGAVSIQAGKYAFFTIPGKIEWTVIINKNWEQHLVDDYDPKDDIVRIKVKPIIPVKPLERLQYFITDQEAGKGIIGVGWEKQLIQFPIEIQ